jgi:hypothetical protein
LVDPAYHTNVGDHMLTLGEIEFLQRHGIQKQNVAQCHYLQAAWFVPTCSSLLLTLNSNANHHDNRSRNSSTSSVALWHAGGNWGDLWRSVHTIRIDSVRDFLQNGYTVFSMPQSLFYRNKDLETLDATKLKEAVALGLGLVEREAARSERFLFVGKNDDGDDENNMQGVATKSQRGNNIMIPDFQEDDGIEQKFQHGGISLRQNGRHDDDDDGFRTVFQEDNYGLWYKPLNTSILDTPDGQALARVSS